MAAGRTRFWIGVVLVLVFVAGTVLGFGVCVWQFRGAGQPLRGTISALAAAWPEPPGGRILGWRDTCLGYGNPYVVGPWTNRYQVLFKKDLLVDVTEAWERTGGVSEVLAHFADHVASAGGLYFGVVSVGTYPSERRHFVERYSRTSYLFIDGQEREVDGKRLLRIRVLLFANDFGEPGERSLDTGIPRQGGEDFGW